MPCVCSTDDAPTPAILKVFLPEVLRQPFKTVVDEFLLGPWEATAASRDAPPSSQARSVLCSHAAAA